MDRIGRAWTARVISTTLRGFDLRHFVLCARREAHDAHAYTSIVGLWHTGACALATSDCAPPLQVHNIGADSIINRTLGIKRS